MKPERPGTWSDMAPTSKKSIRANRAGNYTIPGLTIKDGHALAQILQERLNALNDLALTLKHVHWNVVGPHFIGVHEMIDPHVVEVRAMIDETAERMATLGVAPVGTPGAVASNRSWDDYSLGRATTDAHLGALNTVYEGLISSHRAAQEKAADLDPVTEDMLIGHLHQLELFHWFVRAHLENTGGELSTGDATTEKAAAKRADRTAKK